MSTDLVRADKSRNVLVASPITGVRYLNAPSIEDSMRSLQPQAPPTIDTVLHRSLPAIGGLSKKSPLKGMIVGTFGADVGDRRDAPDRGVERLTFGATDLLRDFNMVAGYLTDSRLLTVIAFKMTPQTYRGRRQGRHHADPP